MDELVNTFKLITHCKDENLIKNCLSSCDNDIQQAVTLYFASKDSQTIPTNPKKSKKTTKPKPKPSSNFPFEKKKVEKKPSKNNKNEKIKTFKNYFNNDEDDEDENQQHYYAGGGKSSGQQIIGSKNNSNINDESKNLAEDLIKKAMEKGKDYEKYEKEEKEKKQFLGQGSRLGEKSAEEIISQKTDSNSSSSSSSSSSKKNILKKEKPEEKKILKLLLTLYLDGFTVNDGQLRKFDDPKQQEILKKLNQGYVPRELCGDAEQVDLELKKVPSKYVPPPKVFQSFSGKGRTLTTTTTTTTATSSNNNLPLNKMKKYKLEENKPKTMIQIKLIDGTRLREKFNTHSTIREIMGFIYHSRPNMPLDFALLDSTSFPMKTIKNVNQTIEEAGLKNSTLLQKKF